MDKKIIVTLLILLLMPTILAGDFKVELKPHYFLNNQYLVSTNVSCDGIAFEVFGINEGAYRILNVSIVDASPQVFKDILPKNVTESLRILQQKPLWTTGIMDIDDFIEGNVTFFIEVKGINEETNEELIAIDSTVLFIKKEESEEPVLVKFGDKIWEDSPAKGLLLVGCAFVVFGFIWWRRKGFDKLDNWRNKSEKKRIERRKWEEGFY